MNKINLIIDALESARNEIHDPTLWTDKVDKALASARELQALKPVAWVKSTESGYNVIGYESNVINQLSNEKPLYALDEVTK